MNIRRFSQIAFMLLMLLVSGAKVSLAAVTTDDITINVTNPKKGSFTVSVGALGASTTGCYRVTLTATFAAGYSISTANITVQPLVDPASTRSNNPGIANNLTVSGSGTSFYFDLPERYHGAQVTATFTENELTGISSLDDITDPNGNYVFNSGFRATGTPKVNGNGAEIGTSGNPFRGKIDGNLVEISNGPLFDCIEGAIIKNVILNNVSISGNSNGNAGAICNEARGASRIYNCGVLATNSTVVKDDDGYDKITSYGSTINGSNYVGGIVGLLEGSSRVINCFSYAEIQSGAYMGGIVGYNNVSTTTPATSKLTMVMNCMFYGDITGTGSKAPIYNGYTITNVGDNAGVSNFNYFWSGASYVKNIGAYNCALAAETRFLQRFEFFRHLLNSNRELAAWWATDDVANKNEMKKWVMEPTQIGSSKPFPILKNPGKYASVVNYTPNTTAYDGTENNRNKGQKLTDIGTSGSLSVTIRMGSGGAKFEAPSGAGLKPGETGSISLTITDKDFEHFNYNYGKVQLPYYNDYCNGNYTGGRVVTGWKIVSITGGTATGYSTGKDDVTYDANGNLTATPYNFADRKCTNKDLYDTGSAGSDRVFNQGAYWDVPEGVTAIIIEPYWGKAVYLADANYDVVYSTDMKTPYPVTTVGGGQRELTFNDQTVYTSMSDAIGTSALNPSGTVYDNAVVLVGNYHQYNGIEGNDKPYTVTSVDLDGDNEPDYSFMLRFDGRTLFHPVRYDFLNLIGLGMAQKSYHTNSTGSYNLGIMQPKYWFEVTNTALFRVTQFEYSPGSRQKKPIILQGGVIEQWVTQQGDAGDRVEYFHVGGNVWFKEFHRGSHQDNKDKYTPHPPISVTGGEYEKFYLTGAYQSQATIRDDNAECYINGGRFGEVAGAGLEGIGTSDNKGNVTWIIDNADIKEFYGGGTNFAKPIHGNIHTIISNSKVDVFAGGPKFGNMTSGKTVRTTATNCIFGTFFGAGYGGNSYNRYAPTNLKDLTNDPNWNNWVSTEYTQAYNPTYNGVSTQFNYQYIPQSDNYRNVARLFVDFVQFSLATTNDVTSDLTGCTITGNFYGGGSLGKVEGDVTSTLTGCTVKGNAYGAGYSASTPTVEVMPRHFVSEPKYDKQSGSFIDGVLPSKDQELEDNKTITYTWKHAGSIGVDNGQHILYTTEDLTALGTVKGKVTLNIEAGTTIGVDTNNESGKVFGGGQSSDVYGVNSSSIVTSEVEVNINGGTMTDVYGGGQGKTTVVGGDVTVNIGKLKENSTTEYEGTATVRGNVYGGSALGSVNAKKDDDWDEDTKPNAISAVAGKETKVNLLKGTVNGSVYGGGLGDNTSGSEVAANVYGPVTVTVEGGKAQYVFGCNNMYGTPKSTVEVYINGTDPTVVNGETGAKTYALQGVYGGGNLAHYDPTDPDANYPTVTVKGCSTSIKDVFGGGNAAAVPYTSVTINGGDIDRVFAGGNGSSGAANVGYKNSKVTPTAGEDEYGTGTSNAIIAGGTINEIYGGSNNKGTVRATGTMSIAKSTAAGACPMKIGSVYGGGNEAPGAAVALSIGCTGTGDDEGITNVFGGANAANVTGNILLTITEGKIANVFGGNNSSGTVSGTITVNINKAASPCVWNIGNVFGGGKDAAYSAPSGTPNYPEVNIKNGTVTNVFGGGQGSGATVTGNPQVTIGDATAGYEADVTGDVYGGGDAAAVVGTPVVHVIKKDNTSIGNVYGGGNAADVSATSVTIDGGTIGMVFGGGHGDKNSDPQKAANVTGGVSVTVTGGTITKVFGGSNSKGNIGGTIALGITKAADASTMKIGEVYGGGNEAAGNAGTINIGCTGTLVALGEGERYGYEQEGIGYVYGGANNADVGNDITLNITGGIVANVFGGNNTGGNISGSITVNIEKDASAACVDNWYVGNVYGGGNVASYRPTTVGAYPEVNIKNGTVSGSVFGGGLGATAKVCSNPKVTIGDLTEGHSSYEAIVTGDVYGGGSAAMVGDDTEGKTSTNNTTVLIQKANSSVANVFGGGMAASVTGTTSVTIAGGTVSTGVYGGCNTSGSVGAVTIALNGGTVGASGARADVFGGGYGHPTTTTGDVTLNIGTATTSGGTTTYSGTAVIYGDVYGGSALGQVNGSSSTTTLNINSNSIHGTIYGGGMGSGTGDETKATTNGNIQINYNTANTDLTGFYGGANANGNVVGNIEVNIKANIGASGAGRDLFGGGLGAATGTNGNVTVNIGDLTLDNSNNPVYTPVVYGNIYGGSSLGSVNDAVADLTTVNILSGTIHGNTYGGGLGESGTENVAKGQVNGTVIVNIGSGTVNSTTGYATATNGFATFVAANDGSSGSIYGCNNTNGSPKGNVTVNVYQTAHTTTDEASYTGTDATYAIDQVFGGGNQANYNPTSGDSRATIHVYTCDNTIRRVFGGGNAAAAVGVVTQIDGGHFDYVYGGGNGEVTAANIGAGGTNLQIHGGKINNLFGGSNASGTITGNMGVSVDNICDCEGSGGTAQYVNEFFCGNNLASIGTSEHPVDITATIACGTSFGDVYGGCNQADIYGNVTLTILGGTMDNVFGGSKGTTPPANATAEQLDEASADINGNVTLNIYGGIIENAFGGSNVCGNITGTITVNMLDMEGTGDCGFTVNNVYGGGQDAAYTPTYALPTGTNERISPIVNIIHGTVSKKAVTSGETTTYTGGNVYGGGKGTSATVNSSPKVNVGYNAVGETAVGALSVPTGFTRPQTYTAIIAGNVYGGGDAAPVNGNARVIYNDNSTTTSVANIFGGGNNASVSGNATVTLKGKATVEGDVFGGGNNGIVGGTATVKIEE